MGRPISKRFLGDAEGAIKVSHYRRSTGNEVAGEDDTYIKSQKSTNKFVVADTSGNWSETLTLVDKAAGSLAAGEFRISATDPEGDASHVSRLYNRTLRIGDGAGEKRKVGWDIDAPLPVSVSRVTRPVNANVVILVSDTSRIIPRNGEGAGSVVSFDGVTGTIELNGLRNTRVINVIPNVSFELYNTDNTTFTPYSGSGGVVNVFAAFLRVTGVTRDGSNPLVILSDNTGDLRDGDSITFTSIAGTTELNGNSYTVSNVIANTSFTLSNTDSSMFSNWVSGGVGTTIIDIPLNGVTLAGPSPVIIEIDDTSQFKEGDVVKFSDIMGTTVLNDTDNEHTFTVGDIVEDASFTLAGTNARGSSPTFNAFTSSPEGKVFVVGQTAIDRQNT